MLHGIRVSINTKPYSPASIADKKSFKIKNACAYMHTCRLHMCAVHTYFISEYLVIMSLFKCIRVWVLWVMVIVKC